MPTLSCEITVMHTSPTWQHTTLSRAAEPAQNQCPSGDMLETAVPSFALELPSPWALSCPFLNNWPRQLLKS
eukprot:1147440-Pelagomonas_calceolata.AAC.4